MCLKLYWLIRWTTKAGVQLLAQSIGLRDTRGVLRENTLVRGMIASRANRNERRTAPNGWRCCLSLQWPRFNSRNERHRARLSCSVPSVQMPPRVRVSGMEPTHLFCFGRHGKPLTVAYPWLLLVAPQYLRADLTAGK